MRLQQQVVGGSGSARDHAITTHLLIRLICCSRGSLPVLHSSGKPLDFCQSWLLASQTMAVRWKQLLRNRMALVMDTSRGCPGVLQVQLARSSRGWAANRTMILSTTMLCIHW